VRLSSKESSPYPPSTALRIREGGQGVENQDKGGTLGGGTYARMKSVRCKMLLWQERRFGGEATRIDHDSKYLGGHDKRHVGKRRDGH